MVYSFNRFGDISPIFLQIVSNLIPFENSNYLYISHLMLSQNAVNFSFAMSYLLSGLPWWFSGKESTCQCRRHGFDSWPGKIPHTVKQLSPCPTTTEPVLQSRGTAAAERAAVQQLWKSPPSTACAPQQEKQPQRSPHSTTRGDPAQQGRPGAAENKRVAFTKRFWWVWRSDSLAASKTCPHILSLAC